MPVGDVTVGPGQLNQSMLDASPTGTRFALLPGHYRLGATLTLKAGQQLLGGAGSVLSGARVLTAWASDGTQWRTDGQTVRMPSKAGGDAPCAPGTPLCNAAEDVYRDDVPLRRVASRAALVPGTFWFDYTNSSIFLADNPSGHLLETTSVSQAVNAPSGGTLRNLVIEKFGNAAQSGAVTGHGVQVQHSTIRLNHGTGVLAYGGAVIDSVIASNGQLGLGAGGDDMLVQDDEIAYNNYAGYDPGWEAGGTKWAYTNRLVVRGNWAHDNHGNGLWTDIDNDATTYVDNLSERNDGIGIFHEISYRAVISNNTVRDNGRGAGYFNGRVGINVTDSPNVEITGNAVSGNVGGAILAVQDTRTFSGRLGPHVLQDDAVHDNTETVSGGYQGLWVYDAVLDRPAYYTSHNIVFSHNSYRLPSLTTRLFLGGDAGLNTGWDKSWTTWLSLGQDVTSTAVSG